MTMLEEMELNKLHLFTQSMKILEKIKVTNAAIRYLNIYPTSVDSSAAAPYQKQQSETRDKLLPNLQTISYLTQKRKDTLEFLLPPSLETLEKILTDNKSKRRAEKLGDDMKNTKYRFSHPKLIEVFFRTILHHELENPETISSFRKSLESDIEGTYNALNKVHEMEGYKTVVIDKFPLYQNFMILEPSFI